MNKLSVWATSLPQRNWMIKSVMSRYYGQYFSELTDKRILEIGCGHGFGAAWILKYFSPQKIKAIDLDDRMITSAKKNIHDSRITFEKADATKLPYKDSSYDGVFDFGVIHHIPGPQWKRSLEEICRVLEPGGKVFIYDVSIESFENFWGRIVKVFTDHPYDSMYRKSEFIDYMIHLGLKMIKQVDLGRYFIVVAEKQ